MRRDPDRQPGPGRRHVDRTSRVAAGPTRPRPNVRPVPSRRPQTSVAPGRGSGGLARLDPDRSEAWATASCCRPSAGSPIARRRDHARAADAIASANGNLRNWKRLAVVSVATDPAFPDPRVTRRSRRPPPALRPKPTAPDPDPRASPTRPPRRTTRRSPIWRQKPMPTRPRPRANRGRTGRPSRSQERANVAPESSSTPARF